MVSETRVLNLTLVNHTQNTHNSFTLSRSDEKIEFR